MCSRLRVRSSGGLLSLSAAKNCAIVRFEKLAMTLTSTVGFVEPQAESSSAVKVW